MTHDGRSLLIAGSAIFGLIALVAACKVHSFVALILTSLFVGLCSGGNPVETTKGFAEGVGSVLGSIALVIALGAILGQTLASSGGAGRIAGTIVGAVAHRWTGWALALVAFTIGFPVFFGVGLVLLIPVVETIAKRAQISFLSLGLILVAGLSVAHGLVPPHPGPLAAVALLKADAGRTIGYSLLVGLPTALICGPLLVPLLAEQPKIGLNRLVAQFSNVSQSIKTPPFGRALFTILLPVMLMLLSTVADILLGQGTALRQWADFVGNPVVAMLAAVLFSFWSFGLACGLDRHQLGNLSEHSLGPIASTLLVIGAGGGFSKVLINSGVGDTVANLARGWQISPLLMGWLIAALIRVATGSATVAITTASGLMEPIVAATPALNRELLIVAMGAGSLILSHVNDAGFWLVKQYLSLTVLQTLKTWTVIESAISVVAFLLVLLFSRIA